MAKEIQIIVDPASSEQNSIHNDSDGRPLEQQPLSIQSAETPVITSPSQARTPQAATNETALEVDQAQTKCSRPENLPLTNVVQIPEGNSPSVTNSQPSMIYGSEARSGYADIIEAIRMLDENHKKALLENSIRMNKLQAEYIAQRQKLNMALAEELQRQEVKPSDQF